MTQRKLLKVGDLAKAVHKTVRAIHLYEELGLLVPVSRSAGGYRLYAEDAIVRVNWIVRLQDIGLSLTEIQGLLREWEQAPNGSTGMRVVRAIFEQKLFALQERHKVITAVRGAGLMRGLELAVDAAPVVEAALKAGLLVNRTAERVVRMLPPLTVTAAEIEEATGILDAALRSVAVEEVKA